VSDLVTVRCEGAEYFADWGEGPRRCAVGSGGIAEKLREGDGVTPQGSWPLRNVFYRADRMPRPRTALEIAVIEKDDGWCDAPGDFNYNRPVRFPYPASAEHLWRDDGLYDIVAIIGFNDAPVVQGKGSAIFLHVAAPDYAPTAGCVALKREDLRDLLAVLSPHAKIKIEGV
jgi:L,D-peptidoglycan transpeptidase YkuD (ErfK/YbiS/YcfS/YnhG family)